MKLIQAFFFSLFWLVPIADAAPSITGHTGTIANDSLVTFTGTGFTSKSPAKPLIWADFATDINPSSLGTRTSWDATTGLTRTTSLPTGAGTANGVYGQWGGASNLSHSFTVELHHYTKIYTFGKRYYDFPTTHNYKFWRLNDEVGGDMADPVWAYGQGDTRYIIAQTECSDDPDRYTNGDTAYVEDTWMTEEFYWQYEGGSGLRPNGSDGLGTGIMGYWRNGDTVTYKESMDNCENTQYQLQMYDNYTPTNTPTDTPATGSRVYMTYLYADTVKNRVIIGNHSTLPECTHREIAVPYSWSGTSVSVKIYSGTFLTNASVYIYIVDSLGVANTSGYGVKIGGSSSAQRIGRVWIR